MCSSGLWQQRAVSGDDRADFQSGLCFVPAACAADAVGPHQIEISFHQCFGTGMNGGVLTRDGLSAQWCIDDARIQTVDPDTGYVLQFRSQHLQQAFVGISGGTGQSTETGSFWQCFFAFIAASGTVAGIARQSANGFKKTGSNRHIKLPSAAGCCVQQRPAATAGSQRR